MSKNFDRGFLPCDDPQSFNPNHITFNELWGFLKDLEDGCYFKVRPTTVQEVEEFVEEYNKKYSAANISQNM